MKHGKSKSIYLSYLTVRQMQAEAERLDRPLSWVAQRAWILAREKLIAFGRPEAKQ